MRESVLGSTAPARGLAAADAFCWKKGVGKSTWLVYEILETAPMAAKAIAAKRGIRVRMVRRHLSRLEAYGLAERDGHGGWRKGQGDLDEAAAQLGALGTGQLRREEHKQQRETARAHPGFWLPKRPPIEGAGEDFAPAQFQGPPSQEPPPESDP